MKKTFTTQEVIDMGAYLYDTHGFSRMRIWEWLEALLRNELAFFDIEKMFDLIVG